jgi:hypothetical protein
MRGGLKLRVRRADTTSMNVGSSIMGAGLGLVEAADARLAQSARTFTQAAATAETETPSTGGNDLTDAAVGVIYGRSAFRMGVALIEVGRDTEKALLDVLA